jgi:hypothetical protein
MVKIEGYLSQKDLHELQQFFWSKKCNSVERKHNELCGRIYEALKKLEELQFPNKKGEN